MEIVFNIVIIALVGLIAYWWANQGLFSAILHFLCVVAAGAIAFGLWEWVATSFLLSGGGFDAYAWGVALIGLFIVPLLILRIAFDRLVPANVNLPHWANLTFGGVVGAGAGVITMGVFVIGAGFLQSSREIAGFEGWARNRNGQVQELGVMWFPVHEITESFYGMLSINALSTGTPLRTYYPDLAKQSASLLRDTYRKGRGAIAMPPDAARIVSWALDDTGSRCAVSIDFNSKARDFGEQFVLGASQARLIERPRSQRSKPRVQHPDQWHQDGTGPFRFDDMTHYAISTAAQQTARIVLWFDRLPANFNPRFVQIKGIRFRLSQSTLIPIDEIDVGVPIAVNESAIDPSSITAKDISSVIAISNRTRPIATDANTIPGTMNHRDLKMTEGYAFFYRSGDRPSRDLRIETIYETTGAKIVQVTVQRNGPADIFGPVRQLVTDDAQIALADSGGRIYPCMGYIYERREGYDIKLAPRDYTDKLVDIPALPTAGTNILKLIFNVTEGVTVTQLKLGDQVVGTCSLPVRTNVN